MHLPYLADLPIFLGRFHPLLVHLPIGMLILAVVLEFWPGDRLRGAIRATWLLGAVAAIAAAGAGWMLASGGGYGGGSLFWHRWGGVTVTVLAVGGCFVARGAGKLTKAYGLLTVGVLSLTGHQGGNLTHGEDYLYEHAPALVQRVGGYQPESYTAADWEHLSRDSIQIYTELIAPVIRDKCVRCHNAEDHHGGLRMDSARHLFAGGESGPLLLPGRGSESRWIVRVTLPPDRTRAMPPQGERLTYTQIRLLEYWIDLGADTLATFPADKVPADLKELLLRDYALDLRPRLFVETLDVAPLDSQTLVGLRSLDWSVSQLLPEGGAVEVKARYGTPVTPGALRELAAAAGPQVAYLHLNNQSLANRDLQPLRQLSNLNRLNLGGTTVSAADLAVLGRLRHLAWLNLYGTSVGDEIFRVLEQLPALREVYLWQTRVTGPAVERYRTAHPDVYINTGIPLSDTTTVSK